MSAPAAPRRSAAPGRHVYDAIVVGGQLAGALTAGLLARRGLQVLLVPHDGLGARYVQQELPLPHVPFLMPPLKALPALEEALGELGLGTTLSRALHPTSLQLLEPGRWYELTHDEKRRGPELARALGDGAEAFDELVRKAQAAGDASDPFFASRPDLAPEGFIARWKFKRVLPRFPTLGTDTPLPEGALLRALTRFVAPVENDAALTRARALGRTLAGPVTFTGGREGLWEALTARAKELGADVLGADEQVERLTLEGGPGVRLARGETVYRAPFVVAALDLDVLTRLMPEKQRKAADKVLPQVTAARALFTLNLVLPEKALPRGLGELALLPTTLVDGGVLLLQVSPGATAEQRVLTLCAPAPVALHAGGEPAVRALIAQLHAALATVMPFTKAHVTLESTPWLDAQPVVSGRGEPAPLFTLPASSWLGVTGHLTSSPWKHVLLASRQVFPGLGLEGDVLAAQRAAKLIEASLKKDDPLKARKSA